MEAKSGRKPINVLAEYLTSWIRKNSDEALPFDSFEALRTGRIAQKHVERWIFNCNYICSCVGNYLYDTNLIPDDARERTRLIENIERAFKAISDSTPLDLRSKPADAIVYELSRDWPPFCQNSRNTLEHLNQGIEQFRELDPAFFDERRDAFSDLCREFSHEAAFYSSISSQAGRDVRALATRCRELLPIWCLKEINPLVSLLIWDDRDAMGELVEALRSAFLSQRLDGPVNGDVVDTWRDAALAAQELYLDNVDDDADLALLTVPELSSFLDANGFSLSHDDATPEIPRWLLGKTRLIWNVVICAILGPQEAIGSASLDRSPTLRARGSYLVITSTRALDGEVLLRRRYRTGRIETIDRLLLDNVRAPGLWKVIGGHYDPYAPIPNSAYRAQFPSLGAIYVASETFDGTQRQVEGAGDSRFHVELAIEATSGGTSIVARDLDSKNGTCILRTTSDGLACFAFPGRRHLAASDWSERLDVPRESVHMVRELTLERGDIIQLADSCFELI